MFSDYRSAIQLKAIRKREPSQITIFIPQHYNQCCGAGARGESRGAENKLPPGAGAEVTTCGSGSFLFIRLEKKFIEKNYGWFLRCFCKLFQFKSYLGTTCINPCKKEHGLKSKRYCNCQGILELKEIFPDPLH